MERTSSADLWATSTRRVTRLQILSIIRIFPFLCLPAELRNVIYNLCFCFNGIESFFHSYYRKFRKSVEAKKRFLHPLPRKRTPSIFLVNRQVHREATALLRKGAIRFRHGLLMVQDVTSVVSANVLQQVSSIEISDAGHSVLKKATMGVSWHGYIHLITGLADVLAQGHQLKKLTLKLTDPRLLVHMTLCFQNHHHCGFRDQLKTAMSGLRRVRGIDTVAFVGFHYGFAVELKGIMESQRSITFATLPPEIRDMIWYFAVDWPDVSKIYTRVIAESITKGSRKLFPLQKTPTALLLNRQYYVEIRNILLSKAFEITFPAFDTSFPYTHDLHLFQYLSRSTLQGVKHLKIRISDQQLFNYFKYTVCEAIAGSKNLRTLSLHIVDLEKEEIMKQGSRSYPDGKLHAHLLPLFTLRGLDKAEVTGDLPHEYTEPLVAIMESAPSQCELLPEPKAIKNNNIVDLDPVKRLTIVDFR